MKDQKITTPLLWQAARSDELIWSKWDETFVVYHRQSGKTHYLNSASERMLTATLAEPCDAQALAVAVSEPGLQEEEILFEMHDLLLHLEELGLVKRL